MNRLQASYILNDLKKKMVFLTGPRQVGKTYLAKMVSRSYKNPLYLNYDNLEDKKIIETQSWLETTDLIIFDELHKMPQWKNYIKGVYDTKKNDLHLLVTGSARLEVFDRIGDSLAGRYYSHRLLPLSPSELQQVGKKPNLEDLLQRGGFPEPYLADNIIEANRWRNQYIASVMATDVFDFDVIQNIKALKTLFELLRTKVGSPISYQSLAEDVAISPNTVKKYIEILEALYIIFRITPHSKNIARSLLKEPKIYFFDTGLVLGDDGIKLENLTAVCLLKHVYAKIDYLAENYSVNYIRTKEGRETDFVLVKDDIITQMIEVKLSNKEISKSLYYFFEKYGIPAVQIVKELRHERLENHIQIIKAIHFLSELFM